LFLNLYWSVLVLAVGACVGSFLNVVIYRWPRDLSLRRPLWSFCPHCRSTLHWKDNIPVLGYVLLRARCRYCRAPISLQYPLVELATAFSFLLVYDAFFVAKLRGGVGDLAADWPMLMAHWVLAAGLIVLTVMDLEAYLVDIRVTWIMAGLGLAFHALWSPGFVHGEDWIRPGPWQSALALAATVGLAIGGVFLLPRPPEDEGEPCPGPTGPAAPPPDPAGPEPLPGASPSAAEPVVSSAEPAGSVTAPQREPASLAWIWAVIGTVLVAAYVASIVVEDCRATARLFEPPTLVNGRPVWPAGPKYDPGVVRTAAGLGVLFVALTLFASHPRPEEDEQIIDAINSEADESRRNALKELGLLLPAILLIVFTAVLLENSPLLVVRIRQWLEWRPLGNWAPLLGIATALVGWVIGGALAWATRVLGTLGLGKEAFGMGDVHIMAGIGAIAGWSVAVLGFFLASVLALLGMLVIHFRRQSRALPYGPWLALASFIVVLYQDRILRFFQIPQ
jgi:prepilin signal peptidase PulO-like enzyme (type II secretory pathway)